MLVEAGSVPLTVRAVLPYGLCSGKSWYVSFDGLLASVVWHRMKADSARRGHQLRYEPSEVPPDLALPLSRCDCDDSWHWACTFADVHAATPEPDVRMRSSRTDHNDLLRMSAAVPSTVSDARGHYRKRLIPATAAVTATATWNAVGDPAAIRELLADVTEIGKYRTSGEGQVAEWIVTERPDLDPWSAAHEHRAGVLGRITPPACLVDRTCRHGGYSQAAVRAPYLHPARRVAAYLPAY